MEPKNEIVLCACGRVLATSGFGGTCFCGRKITLPQPQKHEEGLGKCGDDHIGCNPKVDMHTFDSCKHYEGCAHCVMPSTTPVGEKHECEQGTFCVECGMDNRPTSDWELRFDEEFTIDNGPTVEASIKDPNGMAGPIKAFIHQIEAQAEEKGRREERDKHLKWRKRALLLVDDLLAFADSLKNKV